MAKTMASQRGQMPWQMEPQMTAAFRCQPFPWALGDHPLPATVLGTSDLPKVKGVHQVPPCESAQERQEVIAQVGAEARRESRHQDVQQPRTGHERKEA